MNDIFDSLVAYERSLTTFTNNQLGRIDYHAINQFDHPLINKIMLSLNKNPLIYESSVSSRIQSWLVHLSTIKNKEANGDISICGCLGTEPLFIMQHLNKGSLNDEQKKRYCLSKVLFYMNDYNLPNLYVHYAFLSYTGSRLLMMKKLLSENICVSTIITQALLPNSTRPYRDLFENLNDNIVIILSVFLQIMGTIDTLHASIKDWPLTIDDILITSYKQDNINYPTLGNIKTHGFVGIIANYDNYNGSLNVGSKIFNVGNEKLGSPILSLIKSLSPLIAANKDIKDFFDIIRKKLTKDIELKVDSTLIINEKLLKRELYNQLFYESMLMESISTMVINPPTIDPGRPEEWKYWSDIRCVYNETIDPMILDVAKNAINIKQQTLYRELLKARDEKDLVVALTVLSALLDIYRLMANIFPAEENPAVVALRNMLNNNWRDIKGYLDTKLKPKTSQMIEDLVIDFD